ncbi:MAG: hypothetical protein JXM71_10975 [Spirochaetales bacterium]|nr:hypothetical protein [Spirochaetales bacterium]
MATTSCVSQLPAPTDVVVEAEPEPTRQPEAPTEVAPEVAPQVAPETPEPIDEVPPTPLAVPFDPESVSQELKQTTIVDVQALIGSLNYIIQSKDYDSWVAALTEEYRDYYSSPETLARISEAAVLKRLKIQLTSLKDYFTYVVYPSRQNDRVDDVEFIDATRIRAITINPKGERLVLYNLEKIGDTWKIAIWR